MSQALKRVSTSSVNWQKLAERLIPQHEAELNRLKGQNTFYSSQVNQLPADLPKVDFAALKKQMPAQASILDSLQKQYEVISIPYGSIPKESEAEIEKYTKFNESRKKLHELKAVDGAAEAEKVEAKWAKAPPVEQFTREHFPKYFPKHKDYYDLRVQNRIPDPLGVGFNEYELMEQRFKDYKILRRPDKVDDH